MQLYKSLLVGAAALASNSVHATEYMRKALLGIWVCGPYTMAGPGFEVTGISTSNYLEDGRYMSTTDLTVRMRPEKTMKTREHLVGTWTFDGRIIEVRYDRAEFLWSDDPSYTVDMGQQKSDALLKEKDWSKARVLELDKKLVTIAVDPTHAAAKIAVTCARP